MKIIDDTEFEETWLNVNTGDMILLYTDGIVEAMNDKQQIFGFYRFLEVVSGARSMTADSLLKEILSRDPASVGGAPQCDDLTVIVLSEAHKQ